MDLAGAAAPRSPARSRRPGLGLALQALWFDAKGDWDGAHRLAQEDEGALGCWFHAYLHRKEGDAGNAAYWYRRSGEMSPPWLLEAEWGSDRRGAAGAERLS